MLEIARGSGETIVVEEGRRNTKGRGRKSGNQQAMALEDVSIYSAKKRRWRRTKALSMVVKTAKEGCETVVVEVGWEVLWTEGGGRMGICLEVGLRLVRDFCPIVLLGQSVVDGWCVKLGKLVVCHCLTTRICREQAMARSHFEHGQRENGCRAVR